MVENSCDEKVKKCKECVRKLILINKLVTLTMQTEDE